MAGRGGGPAVLYSDTLTVSWSVESVVGGAAMAAACMPIIVRFHKQEVCVML